MRHSIRGIPHIDLSPIVGEGLGSPDGRAVVEQIHEACSEIGFMSVTGHGISRALIDRMVAAAHRFFSLPSESKLGVAPKRWNRDNANVYRGYFPSSTNGKEGLDVGDPSLPPTCEELLARPYYELNHFPAELDRAWRGDVAGYFEAQFELGSTLLQAMIVSLGGDPTTVTKHFERPRSLSTLRCNFYPTLEAPVESSREDGAALSCETHVDSGLLTILYQDQEGRLQVRDRQRFWHDVAYDPDAFVVNTGLALQRLTDGARPATRHRVLFSGEERISIPFFFEPAYDFVMAPQSLGLKAEPLPEAVSYESFLAESLSHFIEYDRGD